jgi:hypothetical protein
MDRRDVATPEGDFLPSILFLVKAFHCPTADESVVVMAGPDLERDVPAKSWLDTTVR